MTRFDNWYKRRVNRIYPSAIMCALAACLLSQTQNLTVVSLLGGQFVIFIMTYYVVLFFVRKYAIRKIPLILLMVLLVSAIVYFAWFPYKYEIGSNGLYGITTLYRWIPYFGFMLMGAWIGLDRKENGRPKKNRTWLYMFALLICLMLFYGVQLLAKGHKEVAPWQIVTLLPLSGIVYSFYRLCNASLLERLYHVKFVHATVMIVSGLCLESYLIQQYVFTDKLNWLFPLNLFIMVFMVLLVSYVCKCLARIFSQTFAEGDYKWKEVVKLY